MAPNDIVLLDGAIEAARQTGPPGLDDAELFEFFTFGQVLKPYDLSDDELLAGQIGGGQDGGIDGLFVFADEVALDDDFDPTAVRKNVVLALHVIQAKREKSFTEDAVQKLHDTLEDLLDLSKKRDDLESTGLYSPELLDRAEIFRSAVRGLALKRPQVRIAVAYATKGETNAIQSGKGVDARAARLKAKVEELFTAAAVEVRFFGARELYEESLREPTRTLELELHYGTQLSDRGDSYVALVKLDGYNDFLTDETGALRRHIFEGNVRDWQGLVEVNEAILGSLEDPQAPQFWWLNNGVTIVCSKVTLMNGRFVMDEPLIVNGLQSSMVIHNYFAEKVGALTPEDPAQPRLLLVRVIATTDDEQLDKIISSTNKQTPVSAASLRATDQIQRDIEAYFAVNGWFYDRRKNYYRNAGKPAPKIVSIPYLAQAVMAIGLQQPDSARARPSSLIKDETDYRRVFNPQLDLAIYLWVANTQRAVDAFLRTDTASATTQERTNLRFHVGMIAAAQALGKRVTSPRDLQTLVTRTLDDAEFAQAFTTVKSALAEHTEANPQPVDRTAKGREFVNYLLDREFPRTDGVVNTQQRLDVSPGASTD
jgi:hypothetical protein